MKWRIEIEKINEIKKWFFENINKIDKPLIGLNRGMKEGTLLLTLQK